MKKLQLTDKQIAVIVGALMLLKESSDENALGAVPKEEITELQLLLAQSFDDSKLLTAIKLKVLKIVLEKIKSDPLYDMCETIRLTTEEQFGLKIDTIYIQRIFKLKQFKPLDEPGMGHWWPLDEKGQAIRQVIVESLIEDLKKE